VWITHSPGEGNLESNLRQARGGSLLIEEVGGLDPEEQGWLVRSMESADDSFPRLLATSSRDLAAAVTTGALRSDLYYRLQVLEIRLPPLGERLEDLPALADFFAGQLAPGRLVEFAEAALACLLGHDWPGNLRELRNVVSFALTAAAGAGLLESRHLPVHLGAGARAVMDSEGEVPKALRMALSHWIDERLESDPRPNYRDLSEALESVLIEELLPRYGGRLARLASDLQANRTTLRKRLRGAADTD
jgi:DNA-binding NtrC family response regulator